MSTYVPLGHDDRYAPEGVIRDIECRKESEADAGQDVQQVASTVADSVPAHLRYGKPWQAYLPRFLRVLWIPRGLYCGKCPFRDADLDAGEQMWGYCHHERVHDGDDGAFLLWDGCKECGDRWDSPEALCADQTPGEGKRP